MRRILALTAVVGMFGSLGCGHCCLSKWGCSSCPSCYSAPCCSSPGGDCCYSSPAAPAAPAPGGRPEEIRKLPEPKVGADIQ